MKRCDKECEQKEEEAGVDKKTLHVIRVLISKPFNTRQHHNICQSVGLHQAVNQLTATPCSVCQSSDQPSQSHASVDKSSKAINRFIHRVGTINWLTDLAINCNHLTNQTVVVNISRCNDSVDCSSQTTNRYRIYHKNVQLKYGTGTNIRELNKPCKNK